MAAPLSDHTTSLMLPTNTHAAAALLVGGASGGGYKGGGELRERVSACVRACMCACFCGGLRSLSEVQIGFSECAHWFIRMGWGWRATALVDVFAHYF